MAMDKKILNSFIEAEKKGDIRETYNQYFDKYQTNYKEMAKLMLVIKNRLEENMEDDDLCLLYIDLESQITSRSNEKLNEDELEDFCKLADNYCIEKFEEK